MLEKRVMTVQILTVDFRPYWHKPTKMAIKSLFNLQVDLSVQLRKIGANVKSRQELFDGALTNTDTIFKELISSTATWIVKHFYHFSITTTKVAHLELNVKDWHVKTSQCN